MDNSQDQKKPNTFHRAVIAIALADGHNYVQNKPWRESVCLHDYQSKKDEADGLTLIKPVGYRRPEAEGKNFFQLYLCVPYFMLLSTIVQVCSIYTLNERTTYHKIVIDWSIYLLLHR